MAFNRFFDEEIGRTAQLSCLNDGAINDIDTRGLALTATADELSDVAPGIYDAFLAGMSAAATVLLHVGRTDADPLDDPLTTPGRVTMFPGSIVARIRVMPGQKVVKARLLVSGSETLYLVPVVGL
jgi:hypothetical protein